MEVVMSWIKTVPENEATGLLATIYDRDPRQIRTCDQPGQISKVCGPKTWNSAASFTAISMTAPRAEPITTCPYRNRSVKTE